MKNYQNRISIIISKKKKIKIQIIIKMYNQIILRIILINHKMKNNKGVKIYKLNLMKISIIIKNNQKKINHIRLIPN